MTIINRPNTPEFEEGYDRIFRKEQPWGLCEVCHQKLEQCICNSDLKQPEEGQH